MARRITSLNWIRVFEAAARTSSFARASERLGMSAPAVSQQIKALETHFGRTLFIRSAAGVSLTDEGRALLSACSSPLSRIEAITEEFSGLRQRKLVVGASLMFSVGWLSQRLPDFLSHHQDIRVELRALTGRPERPDPDMAIWIAFGPYSAGLVAERLFGEELIPVASPDISATIHSPEDFLGYTLIEPSAHETTWAHVLGMPVLPSSARVLKVDNTLAALELAANNGGVALARAPATDGVLRRLDLKPCLEDFSVVGSEAYHLLYHDGSSLTREAEDFRRWVRQQITLGTS